MKRTVLAAVVLLAMAAVAWAPPASAKSSSVAAAPEPAVIKQVGVAQIEVGMRVKIELTAGRPIVGTVAVVRPTEVSIDMSAEEGGFSGQFTFKKKDIAAVYEVQKQTPDEVRAIQDSQKRKTARIRIEQTTRVEKTRAEKRTGEKTEKTVQTAEQKLAQTEEVEKMRRLVAEFPPGEGWGEEKLRQVRENWILRGLMPSEREARFANVYEDWRRARDAVAAIDEQRRAEEGKTLLLRFPPDKGWGRDRLADILKKEAAGQPVTEEEQRFKEGYETWAAALAGSQPPAPAPPETPKVLEFEKSKPPEEKPAAPPAEATNPEDKDKKKEAAPEEKPAPETPPAEK
jgi:hypothetical protein